MSRLALRAGFGLGFVALLSCGAGEEIAADAGDASASTVASPIEIVRFAGLDARLAELRGEGMLLNFWAIWCAPCVAELPDLVEVAHAYRERGGRVVGISYDLMVPGPDPATIESTMRSFLQRRELDFPVLIYDEDDEDAINERFDLPGGLPITLAIDRHGQIVDRQDGQAGKERFDEMMRRALAKP
jgi:thiol-disulfide isomerase/thioredoxin